MAQILQLCGYLFSRLKNDSYYICLLFSTSLLVCAVVLWLCESMIFLFLLLGKKSHLRKTTEKKLPTKETIAKLQQSEIWKMENEFYEFALEQFQFVRAHAVREKDGELYILAQNFFYEKIYPKSN